MAKYRYNGLGGDNTNDGSFKVLNVGQWVICHKTDTKALATDYYSFVGYVTHVGEWNTKVLFVNCLDKTTGKVEKIGKWNGKTFVVQDEGSELVIPNTDLEHYAPDDDIQRTAMRTIIHQLQLKAVDDNDKEQFFALGALIDDVH